MAEQKKLLKDYENNPFFIAVNGINLVFDLARGVGFLLIALSVLSLFRGTWSTDAPSNEKEWDSFVQSATTMDAGQWVFAISATFIVVLAAMLISALLGGVSAYTSAQIAKGKTVGLAEAFRVSFHHLWSFLWLNIIIFVKVLLWSLLLIIPGIIMAVRYSLAGVAFYDDSKNLRGNAAVKESLRLTKGAWLTTFAGTNLLNLITFGIISTLTTTASAAVLYRQFDKLDDKKPAAHWLSWLTLVLPFVILGLLFMMLVLLVVVLGLSGSFASS